ncbi:MAG TPA: hypothetical protein VJN44_02835, partial [Roseateles sp.]|nr:hypothetical protein [Roseateles sp.]
AVTMRFDGSYGGAGQNLSLFSISSGPGFDGIGFATSDPNLRGEFGFSDHVIFGQSIDRCNHCSHSIGDRFLISVTAYLPFNPGDSEVIYAAQIELLTQGSFIDGASTAVFSIEMPAQFSYASALTFTAAPAVPEPSRSTLLAAGLATVALLARLRRHHPRLAAGPDAGHSRHGSLV